MSLDLGTLRAKVAVDQTDVPRGLAGVRAQFRTFLSNLERETGLKGRDIGRGMARDMARGVQGGLRNLVTQTRIHGAAMARGLDQTLGAGVGGITRILSRVGMGLGAVAAGGVAALVGVGVAGAAMGVKVASGNEQAKISFETMLGGAKAADRFLRQLRDFAAKTPFEFPELQTAASSLISVGINAKDVIPIMTTLGNVTSGMGTGSEGVKRATVALQQMQSAGRITAEDLNQLRDAGIPLSGIFQAIGEKTGKSAKQIAEMSRTGKLGRRELDALMDSLESGRGFERFQGLMEKQSHSLAGLWSTFKDVFGQGLAGIVSRTFPVLKGALDGATRASQRLFGWFDKNRDALGTTFGTSIDILKQFGSITRAVLGGFIRSITHSTGSVQDFAAWLETHQGEIVATFVSWTRGAINFGLGMARTVSAVARGFGGLSDAVGTVVSGMIDQFGRILHGARVAFGWIPGIGPKLVDADDKFKTFADHARGNIHRTGDAARGFADRIDNTLIPALQGAGKSLDKVAAKEIIRARTRDAVAATGRTIDEFGKKGDVARLKLELFNIEGNKGTEAQRRFAARVHAARDRLQDILEAAKRAGMGQKDLTHTWEVGRDRLYREFLQMGYSKKRAQELADKYAGIKPKIETKVTTPGMDPAINKAKSLGRRIGELQNRTVHASVQFDTNALKLAHSYGMSISRFLATHAGGGRVRLPRRDGGGPISGPGTGTSDSILGIDRKTGLATSYVSDGEFVTKESQYKANKEAVETINRGGRWSLVPRLATGGAPSVARQDIEVRGQSNRAPLGEVRAFAYMRDRLLAGIDKAVADGIGKTLKRAATSAAEASGGASGPVLASGQMAKNALAHVGKAWAYGMCLQFVRMMAGAPGGEYSASTAWAHSRHRHSGIGPPSTAAFWGGGLGHVAVNVGNGNIVTTDYPHRGRIGRTTIDRLNQAWRKPYRGWSNTINGVTTNRAGMWTGTGGRFDAPAGFNWTAEKGAELVVNPQLRRYSGNERVLNHSETAKTMGGLGARPIEVHNNFPVTMDSQVAYAAAGGLTVAKLLATGDF